MANVLQASSTIVVFHARLSSVHLNHQQWWAQASGVLPYVSVELVLLLGLDAPSVVGVFHEGRELLWRVA